MCWMPFEGVKRKKAIYASHLKRNSCECALADRFRLKKKVLRDEYGVSTM
jgi:hypothetical protein